MEPWLRGLYDAEGMRAADRWAIEGQGVDSLALMEAAGAAVAEAVARRAPAGPVRVVCGKGNNGGDGLVAARLLREMGFATEVLLLWPADELSADAGANLRRLEPATIFEVDGDVAARLAGSGAVDRRDLRHRLLRRPARARGGGDRGDRRGQGGRRGGGRLRHRLRCRRRHR